MRVIFVLVAIAVAVIVAVGVVLDNTIFRGEVDEDTRSEVAGQSSDSNEVQPVAVNSGVAELLKQMSLEEKCAQLFIIKLDALGLKSDAKELTSAARQTLKESKVGGVILFGGNMKNPDQLKKLVSDVKLASKVAPFVAVDEEGGIISRIGNNKTFKVKKIPAAGEIGGTGDAKVAGDAASTIAEYIKKYGFNVDFAPVADVNSNPDNPVIGTRAFGSEPQKVAEMVVAQVRAFTSAGVISSAKHFPGHGDTTEDTHSGTVVVNKTLAELEATELVPFRAAIAAGVPMIMVAHITVQNIDESGLPSSMSEVVLTEILRKKLGFDGVIITDGMDMGAIASRFSSGEAAVKSLKAGADIILMPADYSEAFGEVVRAVRSGEIDEKAINEKVLRVLSLKEKFGMI